MKKVLSLFSLLVAAPLIALAQGGISFTELKPAQPVPEGKKIDVVEFFFHSRGVTFIEQIIEPSVNKQIVHSFAKRSWMET